MRLRQLCVFPLIVVAMATGHLVNARAQDAAIPFWAKDRRPIAAIGLFNGTWEHQGSWSADEYGLQECWRRGSRQPECNRLGGVQWLISELDRRYHDSDYRRFMLHLPAGREVRQQGVPLPSTQWHVLDTAGIESMTGSVTNDLQLLLTDWLKDKPDVQILIYQGLRFDSDFLPQPWLERGNMAPEHATVPDLTSAKHRTVVQQNTLGWLALSPPPPFRATPQIGFAFDNTGVPDTRDALVSVVEDPTLFGLGPRPFVSGEAIPHVDAPGPCARATLLGEYTRRAPWLATMDFYLRRDPDETWKARSDEHLGFAVRNQERAERKPDGSCYLATESAPVLPDSDVRAAICSAYHRGFVIIHYGGRHDAYIRNLYGNPALRCISG